MRSVLNIKHNLPSYFSQVDVKVFRFDVPVSATGVLEITVHPLVIEDQVDWRLLRKNEQSYTCM
jgi:hypothetical protein